MEREEIIKNNYVILTSDHGELFERGIHGHTNEYLYEPIIKVPLIISAPGQTQPKAIYSPTSSVDLTPTILRLFGKEIPDSIEGKILPGFSKVTDEDRSIYSFVSKSTPRIGKFGAFTISLRKRNFKLIFYSGYDYIPDTFELYDLENDPNELENLFKPTDLISKQMKQELFAKLGEINS
jgi:arylsulfatase A-like enzyme